MTGDIVMGYPGEDTNPPPLTPAEKEHFIAHLRNSRAKLVKEGDRKPFHEAYRWVSNVRVFEAMFTDAHVPGNSIACRIEDLAAYLQRKHLDEEAEEIVEEEDELAQGS